jgi:CBS domain-containing protein
MLVAREFMQTSPLTVSPELSVADLAKLLLEQETDGACVVDDGGGLIGVVTTMDLVFQEKRVHLPSFFAFMDAMLPLGLDQTEAELRKIGATEVREIMSAGVIKVGPETRLDEVATLMVEKHLTLVPVVDGGRLVGVVTKPGLLRAATAVT